MDRSRTHSAALIGGSTKILTPFLLHQGRTEVYDLLADPGETRPNALDLRDARARLEAALIGHLSRLSARGSEAEHGVIDEQTRAALRALGYLD